MAKANTPDDSKPKKTEVEEAKSEKQTRVRWDTINMRNTYANVCNVSSTREEVMILFGTNQTWFTGQEELSVKLSDRVILNPYTAKRLSLLLNNVLKAYESRFGKLQVELEKEPEIDIQQ